MAFRSRPMGCSKRMPCTHAGEHPALGQGVELPSVRTVLSEASVESSYELILPRDTQFNVGACLMADLCQKNTLLIFHIP